MKVAGFFYFQGVGNSSHETGVRIQDLTGGESSEYW
jgi:hypothetical protein